MQQILIRVDESRYDLLLQFLKSLDYVKVVQSTVAASTAPKEYDFSDLAGLLQWEGDALEEQRRLRDEW